jgi:hypothetical protein
MEAVARSNRQILRASLTPRPTSRTHPLRVLEPHRPRTGRLIDPEAAALFAYDLTDFWQAEWDLWCFRGYTWSGGDWRVLE